MLVLWSMSLNVTPITDLEGPANISEVDPFPTFHNNVQISRQPLGSLLFCVYSPINKEPPGHQVCARRVLGTGNAPGSRPRWPLLSWSSQTSVGDSRYQ